MTCCAPRERALPEADGEEDSDVDDGVEAALQCGGDYAEQMVTEWASARVHRAIGDKLKHGGSRVAGRRLFKKYKLRLRERKGGPLRWVWVDMRKCTSWDDIMAVIPVDVETKAELPRLGITLGSQRVIGDQARQYEVWQATAVQDCDCIRDVLSHSWRVLNPRMDLLSKGHPDMCAVVMHSAKVKAGGEWACLRRDHVVEALLECACPPRHPAAAAAAAAAAAP
jgi:hypothetical protein